MAQKRGGRRRPRKKRPTKQQQHTLSWVGALFVVFASLAFFRLGIVGFVVLVDPRLNKAGICAVSRPENECGLFGVVSSCALRRSAGAWRTALGTSAARKGAHGQGTGQQYR